MQDLSYHLAFARRLRLADGLHPAVGEALTRHPTLVALAACLPCGPAEERKRLSFWGRLFSRGAHAGRWQKTLAASTKPRLEPALRLLAPSSSGIGSMARLAMAIGTLSHDVCVATVATVGAGSAGSDRVAHDRALSRLLLAMTHPTSASHLSAWAPMLELESTERDWKLALSHLDAAWDQAGARPGVDALARWGKNMAIEVRSWGSDAPPSLAVGDDAVRGSLAGFTSRDQEALTWMVALSNVLAHPLLTAAPNDNADVAIRAAIAHQGELHSLAGLSSEPSAGWRWLAAYRSDALNRGRNPKPAFIEGQGVPKNKAHTAMISLSDLPPSLPPVSLPPEAVGTHAPPLPAMTQELSLSQIQSAMDLTPGAGPGFASPGFASPGFASPNFATPALTQEISLADIQAASDDSTKS